MFAVRYTEHQPVTSWLHPLVSGLYIVYVTINDIFVRKGGWEKECEKGKYYTCGFVAPI